jgi:hypothetical protein
MKILSLVLAGISLLALMALSAYRLGFTDGRAQGTREALNMNPVSEVLEMACLSLWTNDQNREYHRKKERNK